MEFKRLPQKFIHKGVQLARPGDLLLPGECQIARNVRSYTGGVVQPRPGLQQINASAMTGQIHSIRRLNDDVGQTFSTPLQSYARIVGCGTRLYTDNSAHNAFTEVDSGYSGNPLSIIMHRPEQSPQPWAYISDSLRKRKVRVDGLDFDWGIAPPNVPPTATVAAPASKTVDDFEAATFGDWSAGGAAAGALTNPDRVTATAITHILYDSGSTGWALVNPASMTELREGMFLTTSAAAESVIVKSIHKAVTTTTIESVQYDSGSTGLCTVKLSASTGELAVNTMLRNTTLGENVRVLSVTPGLDGIPSFRCFTVGTFAATNAISGLDAFRAYFANTHAAAETLATKMLQLAISGAGVTYVERTVALDLSTVSSRPVRETDTIAISLQVDNPSLVSEIKVMLDVDASANDFTRNYYYHTVRPSDLTPALSNTLSELSVQQRVIQRRQIDRFEDSGLRTTRDSPIFLEELDEVYETAGPGGLLPSEINQTIPGDSQWTPLFIPVKSFLDNRVGSDGSRTLKNVAKLRVSVNASAGVTLKVDAWWIGGTYGPDTAGGSPLYYRFRYRNKATGEPSAWSPAMRSGVDVQRERLTLTPVFSADPQVDLIDWIRRGGALNTYRYVGTQGNSGTLTDDYPDDVIGSNPVVLDIGSGGDSQNELAGFDSFQPFPVVDSPKSGTCQVKGTEVTWATGDQFNTNWVSGNLIVINNVPYTLHSSPTSVTRISLNENAGTLTGVSFYLPDAIKAGQPLPAVWGPSGGGSTGLFLFGCDQGTLYWTNGNQPGLARKSNQLEVTSGSETLMNGGIYDGRPYVLSSEKMYEIRADNQGGFETQEVANSIGVFSRWAACFGPMIWFIGRDGQIYESEGGQPRRISEDLGVLLPHEGQPGVAVNGINPPDFTQMSALRLFFGDGMLRFTYLDTGGINRTWLRDLSAGGWASLDTFTPEATCHYDEEGQGVHSELVGGRDGRLYQVTGESDHGSAIACQYRTGAVDGGDGRSKKLFGDFYVSLDRDGATVSVQPGFDDYSVLPAPTNISTGSNRNPHVIDVNAGAGTLARNVALDFSWSVSTGAPSLYEWQPSFVEQPEDTNKRATDWTDGGYIGAKWLQGVRIECDTGGLNRTVDVQGDNRTVIATLTINSNGQAVVPKSFTPAVTHLMRLVPTASSSWRLWRVEWVFEPEPELVTDYITQVTGDGMANYKHWPEVEIELLSTATVIYVTVIDGVSYAYPIDSTAGARVKRRFRLQAVKGRTIQHKLTSGAGFRLYRKDCHIFTKAWGDAGSYQSVQPFGDDHNVVGARI